MKTKSKHLHSETSGVFSNAISHSFNQLFPVNVQLGFLHCGTYNNVYIGIGSTCI